MRPARHRFALLAVGLGIFGTGSVRAQSPVEAPHIIRFPNANSRDTYFTIHNIREAWEVSKGAGVKVGILDHSFGYGQHEGLYAGGENFQTDEWGSYFSESSHHGFFMATTLREVAPEVDIYALGTYSSDEKAKVDAMVRAIDWAIEHDLDVLTYSARRFTLEKRPPLDSAVDRALAHGIVIAFIHYPHPGNLFPTGIVPRAGDDEREPDLNILHYDYQLIFTERYLDWLERGEESGYRPYLSISSTSPVTAAVVAFVKSVRPDLTPGEIKRVLMETARPMEFEGYTAPRVVDAAAAVNSVID